MLFLILRHRSPFRSYSRPSRHVVENVRVAAPFGEPAKGVAFLGLLFSIAGFFSFSQNLVVDGFITLPNIPLPSLPMPQGDGGVDYDAIMSMQDAPVSAETAESIDLL